METLNSITPELIRIVMAVVGGVVIVFGNALVMGIRRKGEVIVPHGDTAFRLGDVVMLIGSPPDIREAQTLFEARFGWGISSP